MMRCLLGIFFITYTFFGYSQENSLRQKKIICSNKQIQIDTLSIYPNSFFALYRGDTLPSSSYYLSASPAQFKLLINITDSLEITYRVLPFNLSKSMQRFDSTVLFKRGIDEREKFQIVTSYSVNDVFGGQELNKNGSVSRGVSFGNSQDLGINSALNLELSGNLAPNLKLLAVVSDANIPIQADGNTNKLQEFDQVFIQVYNDDLKLSVGDFWLSKPQGYFMSYKKRAQGITNEYQFRDQKNGLWQTQISGALSKGKFNRQIIQGMEGNQGPYRLNGSENEPFIIILAGTERVFIDGKQLERGQAYDYTIDYNSSELIFTSRHLITKDSRIVVEFQYSDQNYARSLFQSSIVYTRKKNSFWLNAYSEQDAKNQSLQQDLSSAQKYYLSQIGDNLNSARISSIDSIGFFDNQVLYKMIDSLGYDSVLVFSVDPDSAVYRSVFQQVGAGKGDYVLNNYNAVGKVYKWIAPIGGISQGDYTPSRIIITPKQKQMLSAGLKLSLANNLKLESEFALTSNDLNTYSKIGNQDNFGLSQKTKIQHEVQFKDSTKGWRIESKAEIELLNSNFSPIEQYRSVEFDRDWNTRNKGYLGQQIISSIGTKILQKNKGFLQIMAQRYDIGNNYNGQRVFSDGKWKKNGWDAKWDASYLYSASSGNNPFIRHRATLSKDFGKFKISYKDDHENNRFIDSNQVLRNNSYQFFDYECSLSSSDSTQNFFKFYYRERYDMRSDSIRLKGAAKAQTIGGEITLKKLKNQRLNLIGGYRILGIKDTNLIQQTPENSLIGRVDYEAKWFKNALTWSTFYEIGSGLEQQRTFIYIQVNDGQGVYTWIDYNNDNIKDLNEFEIAQYVDQASYIRVFTPSNNYTKTYTNEVNQSIFWRPEKLWSKKKGVLQLLSKFSNQTRWRINKKINSFEAKNLFNPFSAEISDLNLLSTSALLRNSIYFNRTSNRINAEYTFQDSKNKTLLASGFDARSNQMHELFCRWNIIPTLSIEIKAQSGLKTALADYTSGRNYQINYTLLEPSIMFQPSTNYRFSIDGRLGQKNNNPIYTSAQCTIKEIGGTFKYNQTDKGSFQGTLKYINMTYTGTLNGAVAYEMMESLRPGVNYTWNMSYQRTLSKNLQLNLQYIGRKSEGIRPVHSGSMEIRAYF